MAKVKTNPRLTTLDIIEMVAKSCSLTKDQVKECFTQYAELYKALMTSENTAFDFEMPLPYIGTFRSRRYYGKKKGSTYIIHNFKGEYIEKTVDEDRPDYVLPVFIVKPEIKNMRKKASKLRWTKGKEQNV